MSVIALPKRKIRTDRSHAVILKLGKFNFYKELRVILCNGILLETKPSLLFVGLNSTVVVT